MVATFSLKTQKRGGSTYEIVSSEIIIKYSLNIEYK